MLFAFICLAISTPGKPKERSSASEREGNDSPQNPITLVDNSSHTAQADRAPDKPPKTETPTEWANWALVVVGVLTFGAIWWQAKKTAEATQAMRDSVPLQQQAAAAAKASADAIVNSERAWIIVNIRWTQGKVFFIHSTSAEGSGNTARETTGVDIDLLYINEGRSPAWIVEEKVRMEVVLSPVSSPSLDTEDTQFNERYEPVSVNKTSTNQHRIFGQGWNGSHAYIYGRIKYRDIFTPPPKEPRETWFGFRVSANGNIGRIVSYEYNRFT